MRVLLVEDDATIREYVAQGVREAGHAVDELTDGADAIAAAALIDYDAVILDIAIPSVDGLEVCRRLRAAPDGGPPILFLTARDSIQDRVAGLDAGAEDYLVKPFAFAELLARLRSLLRRGSGGAPLITVGDLQFDPGGRRVTCAGAAVHLSAKESALLEYLMRNAGLVVSKRQIAEHVWDFDLTAETNFIEVFVYSLRKKLGSACHARIQTVRGSGYRLDMV